MRIEPITIDGLDCYTNIILSVINWKYSNYQLAFLDTWDFMYDEKKEAIGEKMHLSLEHIICNAQKIYGLNIYACKENDKNKLLNKAIKFVKSQIPVIVCCDTFYINWYEDYNKKHSFHSFIICSVIENKIKVIDTLPPKSNVFIEYNDLLKGIQWVEVCSFENKSIPKIRLKDVICRTITRKSSKNEVELLKKLCSDLSTQDIWSQIFVEKYVWSIPLLNNIRRVYGSRVQYKMLVNYMAENENAQSQKEIFNDFFEPIIFEWGMVVNLFYKMRINQKKEILNQKIIPHLKKLIVAEQKAMDMMQDMANDSFWCENSSVQVPKTFVQLPVAYNFHSHFFEKGDFVRRTELKTNVIWETPNIKFKFLINNEKNCLICKGQKIKLPVQYIKRIHFVGYATWGNQIEELVLEYENRKVTVDFAITDWCLYPAFDEKILWHGKFEQQNSGGDVYNGYIFDRMIDVENTEKLFNICLPICKKIFLFAIVLEC